MTLLSIHKKNLELVLSLAVHEVNQQFVIQDELLQILKENLKKSVNRMKQFADQKMRDVLFAIGKQVLLKLYLYC